MENSSFLPPEFILFDTEYTTWEGTHERNWSGPNEYREIVQIGAIRIKGAAMLEVDSCLLYTKPLKNPILSAYFTELTGISQETVEKEGLPFAAALDRFKTWCGETTLYSYGNDGTILEENCVLIDTRNPFSPSDFSDIRTVFEQNGIDTKGYISSTIVRAFGKEPTRRGHDALSDARLILDALHELAVFRKRSAIN
ncbi:MAG: 3'-5' exonuclease [Patescibacteria group bacterium]